MFSECPACSQLLQPTHYGNLEAGICSLGCGGIWLGAHDIETLAHQPRVVEQLIAQTEFVQPIHRPQQRSCPVCRHKLNTSTVRGVIEVEIDTCPQCLGVWLDKGEIEALTRLHRRAKLQRIRPHDHHLLDADDVALFALDSITHASLAMDLGEIGVESIALAVEQAPAVVELAAGMPEATVEVVSVTASAIAEGAGASAEVAADILGGAAEGFVDLLGGLFSW